MAAVAIAGFAVMPAWLIAVKAALAAICVYSGFAAILATGTRKQHLVFSFVLLAYGAADLAWYLGILSGRYYT